MKRTELRDYLARRFALLAELRCAGPGHKQHAPLVGALVRHGDGLAVVWWSRPAHGGRTVHPAALYEYYGTRPPENGRRHDVTVVALADAPNGVVFQCDTHKELEVVPVQRFHAMATDAKKAGRPVVRTVFPAAI